MTTHRLTLTQRLRLCLGLFLMAVSFNLYAGTLTASVDRDTIGLEETFILVLRYDKQINASPDYSLLQKDFDILNTQSGTQMSIINGNMEASTEWKIALAPKRIGTLLIPSFTIDGAISDAIPITVEGKSRSPKQDNSQVSVEIETDKDTVFVQEQIIATLRLYTTVGLSGIDLQPLTIKDALVIELDEKQFQTKINGRPGAVVETRYAIFPQQSGELVIPSTLYQVSLDSGRSDLWNRFYGNSQSNILRLRTEEQRIPINPAPPHSGQEWLPAKKVELIEHWSAGIDSLTVGEPITRTITIKAEGLTAGQIAPLVPPSIDGLTFYRDQAQTDDQKTSHGIVGSRIETLAIVPTKAGRFTLPETTVSWWDTQNQRLQTATLPAVTLEVGSGAMSSHQLNAPATPSAEQDEDFSAQPLNTQGTQEVASGDRDLPTAAPLWLYATNAITLILSLFFAWRYFDVKRALTYRQTAKQYQRSETKENEATAWAQVKQAATGHDLSRLRKTLIAWGQLHGKNENLKSLQPLGEQLEDSALAAQFQQLDAAIYSGKASSAFDSQALLQRLSELRRRKHKTWAASDTLQPLYKRG